MNNNLKIQTYSASEAGFLVNSYLLTGLREAALVDAQLLQSEAHKVVELIKNSGKKLQYVFITHPHPDHYLGLPVILKAFPDVPVFSTEEVISGIRKNAHGYIDYYKKIYGSDIADDFIVPHPISSCTLELEGTAIDVVELGAGESANTAALYVPSLKTLISGDAVFNKVHLWLAEKEVAGWLKNLDRLESLGEINAVLPGHGEPMGPKVFNDVRNYLQTFSKVLQESRTQEEAVGRLKEIFPDYRLPKIAEISVEAHTKIPAGV